MMEAAQQEGKGQYKEDKKLANEIAKNTEFNKKVNNGQASSSQRKYIGIAMPSGFSWKQREVNIRQY